MPPFGCIPTFPDLHHCCKDLFGGLISFPYTLANFTNYSAIHFIHDSGLFGYVFRVICQ